MFSPNVSTSTNSPSVPTPSLPQPSLLLKISSWIVILGSVSLLALFIGELITEPINVFAFLGSFFVIPLVGMVGTYQYLATFRSNYSATRFVYCAFLCNGSLFAFGTIANLFEFAIKGNSGPNNVSVLIILFTSLATVSAVSFWLAWLNLAWSNQLKAQKPKNKTSYQISLREMFLLLSLVGLFMGIFSYVFRTASPLFAEHVSTQDAPQLIHLPSDAKDVCFSRWPDSILCEFSKSEEGLRHWILIKEDDLNRMANERVPERWIGGPMNLSRYKRFLDDKGQPVEIEIKNGLSYNWSDEFLSKRVIYDCDSKRAYYERIFTD